MWTKLQSFTAALIPLACLTTTALSGQSTQLTTDDEIRLAKSAGPAAVSNEADIYVMGERGFEKAVAGTNGFACIVVREAGDASTLAPHCLNDRAVETVLPAMLLEGSLQAEGLAPDVIRARIDNAFDSGDLELPSGPAYAYMLSSGQRLGSAGSWKPHFMLYVPYATNAKIGGDPSNPSFPFVGPREGGPLSTVVIVTPQFVDPVSETRDGSPPLR